MGSGQHTKCTLIFDTNNVPILSACLECVGANKDVLRWQEQSLLPTPTTKTTIRNQQGRMCLFRHRLGQCLLDSCCASSHFGQYDGLGLGQDGVWQP